MTASVLLLGRPFSGNVAGFLSVRTMDRYCSGSVNRWASSRLEIYRQQLIVEHRGDLIQDEANAAIRALNWFDQLITDHMLDKQRQAITDTTLRTSFCRPMFQ